MMSATSEGGAIHGLIFFARALYCVRTGDRDGLNRTSYCLEMAARQVEIDGCVGQVPMSEKDLDGPKVGAGFGTQQYIAVVPTLAPPDAHDHPPAIDIRNPEMTQF